jgi:alanyl-tRNA synthetase
MGAMALFGEKYGDIVRVVDMGEFSIELCGGTHVNSTGNIGPFRILSEGGVASGVRRVEAITGEGAWQSIYSLDDTLNALAQITKANKPHLLDKVTQLVNAQKDLEKQVQQLNAKLASNQGEALLEQVQVINGVNVLAVEMQGADTNLLRESLDKFKDKLEPAVVLLASVDGDKVTLVAGVSKSLTGKYKAGELVNHVALQVGGKGGGRPDMAQAGGKQPENLPAALLSVASWVAEK